MKILVQIHENKKIKNLSLEVEEGILEGKKIGEKIENYFGLIGKYKILGASDFFGNPLKKNYNFKGSKKIFNKKNRKKELIVGRIFKKNFSQINLIKL